MARWLLLLVACAAFGGCAETVRLKTAAPDARVRWNGGEATAVPAEGLEVEVPAGTEPVPYVVEADGETWEGVVERSRIDWFLLGLGLGAGLLCAPGLALAGLCLANPAVAVVGFGCLFGNLGGCASLIAAPSWLSLPFASAGFGLGLVGFVPALFADRVPREVTLADEPPYAVPSPAEGTQAW